MLKIKNSENTFFWSDLHIGHDKPFIYKNRGFLDEKEHRKTIIENWKSKINDKSTVFLLGDTIVGIKEQFGEKKLTGTNHIANDSFVNLLLELPFENLFIMPGNHFSGYESSIKFVDENLELFGNKIVFFLDNYFEVMIGKQGIILCHYPITSWNHMEHGSFMLHGHVHSTIEESNPNYPGRKILDIGVDNCAFPLEFGELCAIMAKKKEVSFRHKN